MDGVLPSLSEANELVRGNKLLEAKETFAVITTSDTRPYGCFIFTKGVLKPDGTVWVL